MIGQQDALVEARVHLARVHRLFPDVHLAEGLEEVQDRLVQPLLAHLAVALRPAVVPCVHALDKLEDAACKLAVDHLLALRATCAQPPPHDRPDNVHEPSELALKHRQRGPGWHLPRLAGAGVRRHQRVDDRAQIFARLRVVEAREIRNGVELLLQLLLVFQWVLNASPARLLAGKHRRNTVQATGHVRRRDLGYVIVQEARAVALQIRHATDEPAPEPKQVVN
mmetsp:Transcript_751/g.2919  ORF Transcript_751/g.2919 Transcript_751/m.2919 type:complete len:224 (+) Transcript_751:1230-1901(+)